MLYRIVISYLSKQATSVKVDSDLWKEFRKYCIDADKSTSEAIEDLIRSFLNGKK